MTEKNLGGRPPEYSEKLCDSILEDISCFVPYDLVATSNGIHPSTLYRWLERGLEDMKNKKDTILSRFCESVKKANKNRVKIHIEKICSAKQNWQSSAWLLERCHWKDFSAKVEAVGLSEQIDELKRNESKGDDKWKKKKEKNSDQK